MLCEEKPCLRAQPCWSLLEGWKEGREGWELILLSSWIPEHPLGYGWGHSGSESTGSRRSALGDHDHPGEIKMAPKVLSFPGVHCLGMPVHRLLWNKSRLDLFREGKVS